MKRSVVEVGRPTDTGPFYVVTITRNAADTTTDYTTVSAVVLILPDNTTEAVTPTSVSVNQWVGRVKYNAWFGSSGSYPTRAKVTFLDGTVITLADLLEFNVH